MPVIGLLQVGLQAFADRYTYLPQIGLCLAGTWAIAEWAGKWRLHPAEQGIMAAAIPCVLLVVAYHQTLYWHDSETFGDTRWIARRQPHRPQITLQLSYINKVTRKKRLACGGGGANQTRVPGSSQ